MTHRSLATGNLKGLNVLAADERVRESLKKFQPCITLEVALQCMEEIREATDGLELDEEIARSTRMRWSALHRIKTVMPDSMQVTVGKMLALLQSVSGER